jgi:CHAT domain-containing protein
MTAMVKAGNDSEAHPSNWAAFILVGEGGTARQ